MPEIKGTLTYEKITAPRGHQLLRGFSCGNDKFGKGITGNVANIYRGQAVVTVAAMTHEGKVAGVCAWQPRPLPPSTTALYRDTYIHTVGLSKEYRSCWLEDGTRISTALLTETLRQIRADESTNTMPGVWALVHPFNKKGKALFASHGFALRAPIPNHDLIFFRPPGLEP